MPFVNFQQLLLNCFVDKFQPNTNERNTDISTSLQKVCPSGNIEIYNLLFSYFITTVITYCLLVILVSLINLVC